MAAMRESCVVSDDMPPPLEDMSQLLRTVEGMRDCVRPKRAVKKSASVGTNTQSSSTISKMEHEARQLQKHAWEETDKQEDKHQSETKKTESDSICGFKKGFLLPKTKPKAQDIPLNPRDSTTTLEPDIPFIKPKSQSSEDSQYRMPEVQQAMDASRAFLENKEWVTEDLLTQIQGNDVLAKKLQNPGFAQALNEFQANPQAAMIKYGSNPEMQAFLMEFCRVLGDHFTQLGDMQPTQTTNPASQTMDMCVRSSSDPSQVTSDDEEKMQRILAKPEVREALLDADIQRLLEMLRTNPDGAQRLLATCDRQLKEKVKILVDNGLLQFQM